MDDNEPRKYGEYTPSTDDFVFGGCRLICTCSACPEQYAVYDNKAGQQIGYLRLRHGHFRADYPTCGGETVYEAKPTGDGSFENDHERVYFLSIASAILELKHKQTTNSYTN